MDNTWIRNEKKKKGEEKKII